MTTVSTVATSPATSEDELLESVTVASALSVAFTLTIALAWSLTLHAQDHVAQLRNGGHGIRKLAICCCNLTSLRRRRRRNRLLHGLLMVRLNDRMYPMSSLG